MMFALSLFSRPESFPTEAPLNIYLIKSVEITNQSIPAGTCWKLLLPHEKKKGYYSDRMVKVNVKYSFLSNIVFFL